MRGNPVHPGRQQSPPPRRQKQKKERYFGDRDWVLPYSIGIAVFGLAALALLTAGSQAMPLGTAVAFVLVILWLVIGLCLVLCYPVMIGISERPKKFRRMLTSIVIGLLYFIVSGVLMANFSLPM